MLIEDRGRQGLFRLPLRDDAPVYWNEQYLLQAFLSLNDKFEILCALYALARRRPDKLRELISSWRDDAVPGAFWIRRR